MKKQAVFPPLISRGNLKCCDDDSRTMSKSFECHNSNSNRAFLSIFLVLGTDEEARKVFKNDCEALKVRPVFSVLPRAQRICP